MSLEIPTAPDGRVIEERSTARVLLVNPEGRVLLLQDSDPGAAGTPRFWLTPGGALDPGENTAQAAVREVAEETGLRLPLGQLGKPLGLRHVRHGYSDRVVIQREVFFAAQVEHFEPDHTGFTADERATVQDVRWWSVSELDATTELVWPTGLAPLVQRVADGDRRPWGAALPEGDESTVSI